jgi:hypothetical protein
LGNIYGRTAKGNILFIEIRNATRNSPSSIHHHRIYNATWIESRTNVYQLGSGKQDRVKESNVNKTDEKELGDDNTPDDIDAFHADVFSVFGEFGRNGELRCKGVSCSHRIRSGYNEWNSPKNSSSDLRIEKGAFRKKEENIISLLNVLN